MTILEALINTARELNEPGELNAEYARGQANLIVDACGLVQDMHHDAVLTAITHQCTMDEFWSMLRDAMP